MTEADRRFMARAIQRQKVFLVLSGVGVLAGLSLFAWAILEITRGADSATGLRFALAILVLLNARQNLRQAKFANILKQLEAKA